MVGDEVVRLALVSLLGRDIVHQLRQGGQLPTSAPTENSDPDVLVIHAVYEELLHHQVPVGVDVVTLALDCHIT